MLGGRRQPPWPPSRSGRHAPLGSTRPWGTSASAFAHDRPKVVKGRQAIPRHQSGGSPSPAASIKGAQIRGFGGAACKHNCPACTAAAGDLAQRAQVTFFNQHPAGLGLAQQLQEARARSAAQACTVRWTPARLPGRPGRMAAPDQSSACPPPKRSDSPLGLQNFVPVRPLQQAVEGRPPPRAGPDSKEEGRGLQTMACHQKDGLPRRKASPRIGEGLSRKVACRRRTAGHKAGLATKRRLTAKARLSRCGLQNDGRPPHPDPGREPTWACPQTRACQQRKVCVAGFP